MLSSSAGGTTWSPVSRIPLDPVGSNVDHFIPGLAVSRTSAGAGTQLALTYYLDTDPSCSGLTCQIQVGFASSLAYGQTWSAPQILSNLMQLGWIAPTTQGAMVGVCRSPEGPRRREPHPERSGGVHRRRYHPIHTVLIDSAAWPRIASTPSAATPTVAQASHRRHTPTSCLGSVLSPVAVLVIRAAGLAAVWQMPFTGKAARPVRTLRLLAARHLSDRGDARNRQPSCTC